MTEEPSDRRDRLIAAALSGELTAGERREFDLECSADPELLSEYRALREVSDRLARSDLSWDEQELPPGLADRVFAATSDGSGASSPTPPRDSRQPTRDQRIPRRSRSRMAVFGVAAAGLLILGGLGGAVTSNLLESPPDGPPGALGAVEQVTFATIPDGTSFDAALIAHTWGTETVLEVDGLAEGEIFEVILVNEDGTELTSGTFFGTEQKVVCRLNAALLREDVSQLQIRDEAGTVLVSSTVPDV